MVSSLLFFLVCVLLFFVFFFFKQKTAYEMRISDWSSDVCSSDLQRLSAFRTSRLGGWTPGESVEVRPFNAIGHELLQEERCRGGARESALGTIVEIGDIGFQHLGIRCPQRQTPDRIVDVAASFAQRVRQGLVIGE